MKVLALLLPITLAFLFVASCGDAVQSRSESSASQAGTKLHRGNGGNPGTLDPALAEDVHAFNVLADLYEGLVAVDADGKLIPGVARSWTASDDGLRYTFVLRENAKWSNGDPVTANDFVLAFQHVSNKDTHSAYAFLLDPIENFAAIKSGELAADKLGVIAAGDHELTIRLIRPTSFLPSVLSMAIASPLHPAQAGIGNGPYVLVSQQPGGPIELRRNENYWDANSVAIETVVYYPIVDEVAELNQFRAGELHVTNTIPPSHIVSMRESRPSETRIAPKLAFYYIALDLTEPPLDDVKLRQALSMAIDREDLVNIIGRGELPAFGIVPPGVAGYQAPSYAWRALDRAAREQSARELFAEAGYGEARRLALKYTYDADGIHEKIALAVGSMWQDVLGVEVNYDKREWQHFLETREHRDQWQVMRFSWFGDYDDPMSFLEIFGSNSPQNLSDHRDSTYDAQLDLADNTADRVARAALLTEAELRLLENYPVLPLYFYVSKHMVQSSLHGFESNVLDRHPSRYLYFINP